MQSHHQTEALHNWWNMGICDKHQTIF